MPELHPTVVAALIGALTSCIVTTIGWLMSHALQMRSAEKNRARAAALAHLQRQIEEGYSPLVGLLQQRTAIDRAVHRLLPPRESEFTADNHNAWHYLLSKHLMPLNAQIAELVRSRVDLFDDDEVSRRLVTFLDYATYMECVIRLWDDQRIPTRHADGTDYPADLEPLARGALARLQERYGATLERIVTPNHRYNPRALCRALLKAISLPRGSASPSSPAVSTTRSSPG